MKQEQMKAQSYSAPKTKIINLDPSWSFLEVGSKGMGTGEGGAQIDDGEGFIEG